MVTCVPFNYSLPVSASVSERSGCPIELCHYVPRLIFLNLDLVCSVELFPHFAPNFFFLILSIPLNHALLLIGIGVQSITQQVFLTITQFLTPTQAQLQRHRLKFIKNPYKNSYMFRSTAIFRELQYPR